MSAIQKELVKLLDVDAPKKAADRPDFLLACVRGLGKVSDEQWNSMSAEAQNWYNDAVDVRNKDKGADVPDFPDYEEEKEESAPRRRTSASDDESSSKAGTKVEVKEKDLKPGMAISLETLRGKEDTGHVVEVVKGVLAIKRGDGEEVEYDLDRVKTIWTLAAAEEESGGRRRRSAEDDEPSDPLKEGATVTLVTARGKEVTGEIVELTKDLIVLKEGKEEVEYPRDRIKSVTVAKSGGDEGGTRRRAAADDKDKGGADTKTRSDNGGVSIGQRIRELVLDNLDATQDEIEKMLVKEKLEFKGNTLAINFKDTHKFIALLKERKMLK